jgi:hypothetical protein
LQSGIEDVEGNMGEIVSLRTARKRAKRQAEDRRAAENRLAYGRSKAQRALDAARSEKKQRDHDAHRIGTGDDS